MDAYIAGTDDAISDEAKKGLHSSTGKLIVVTGLQRTIISTDLVFITMGQLLIQMITRAELTSISDFLHVQSAFTSSALIAHHHMHDGSSYTLSDSFESIQCGGVTHDYVSEWIEPLNLSEDEIVNLEEFLKTL